jgi:hypothetical protein
VQSARADSLGRTTLFLGLTFVDWCVVVGGLCSPVLVAYAIWDHHGARGTALPSDPATKRRPVWPWVLAIFAWSATVADFADRHWLSAGQSAETPLSQTNARLDVYKWEIVSSQPMQINVNANIVNNGKNTAAHMKHSGSMSIGTLFDGAFLDGYFYALTEQVKANPAAPSSEINIGENDVSYPVLPLNMAMSESIANAIVNGTNNIFVFNVMQYQDYTIGGKHIYGEQCVYLNKGVVHQCEGGHNRTYVAD